MRSGHVAAKLAAGTGAGTGAGAGEGGFASPASTSLDELVGLRSMATALARRQRRSAASLAGGAVSRRLGRGLDFAEVREYRPGDDVRMIDWKVTARTGQPHTKLFTEERERPVHLLVDFRASMRFGTRGMYKSALAARLAAVLGWAAVAAHDRVGGFAFTDDWHAEVRPRSGREGLMGLFRALVHAQNSVPGRRPESGRFTDTLRRLAAVAHPGASVYLFSDFKDFDGDARRLLGGALGALDVVAVHVIDPLDEALPAQGRLAVSGHGAGGAVRLEIDSERQRRAYGARYAARREALEALLGGQRHRLASVSTAEPLANAARTLLLRSAG